MSAPPTSNSFVSNVDNIHAVNIKKLSELIGCTEVELMERLKTQQARVSSTQSATGIVIQRLEERRPAIHQVVLDAAVERTHVLDYFGRPKCLMEINGVSILSHILTRLYQSGITRIVMTVSRNHTDAIIHHVQEHAIFQCLEIEFCPVEDQAWFDFKRKFTHRPSLAVAALVRAKECLNPEEPFLYQRVDRIFDSLLIRKFAQDSIGSLPQDGGICALVDTEPRGAQHSSEVALLDRTQGRICKICQTTASHDDCGIITGLYACQASVLDIIEHHVTSNDCTSFTQVLSTFIQRENLSFTKTSGHAWFNPTSESPSDFGSRFGGLRNSSSFGHGAPFHGFYVNVEVLSSGHARVSSSSSSSLNHHALEEGLPLLGPRSVPGPAARSSLTTAPRSCPISLVHDRRRDLPFVVELPPRTMKNCKSFSFMNFDGEQEDETSHRVNPRRRSSVDFHSREAYLIELGPRSTTQNQFVMAIADDEDEKVPRSLAPFSISKLETFKTRGGLRHLPTDVHDITFQVKHLIHNTTSLGPGVQVLVKKQTPVIGYLIIFCALLAMSSLGSAYEMEGTLVAPVMKLFWRTSLACALFTPVAYPHLRDMTWTPHLVLSLVQTGLAQSQSNIGFLLAMVYTSVGDAYLFCNTHSLLLVLQRLILGQTIRLMEGSGAILGFIGALLCSLDTGSGLERLGSNPMLGNVIGLAAAMSGVVYLSKMQELRNQVPVAVFMWSNVLVVSIVSLGYIVLFEAFELSRDPNVGLFGWMDVSWSRLPVELFLVLGVNGIGATGFVASAKYFDAIVISVVMLLQPVVASILGVAVGSAEVPNGLTIVGGLTVICGTMLVLGSSKTEEIDISAAVVGFDDVRCTSSRKSTLKKSSRAWSYGSTSCSSPESVA